MITINSESVKVPDDEMFIGFIGDNHIVTRQFLFEGDTNEDCIYRLYLKFDDGTCNHFTLDSEQTDKGVLVSWKISESQLYKSGAVEAQFKVFRPDGKISHTKTASFIILDSLEFSEVFKERQNSEYLELEKKLNSILNEIKTQRCMLPQISDNCTWMLYNTNTNRYEDSGITCRGDLEDVTQMLADYELISNKTDTMSSAAPSSQKYLSEKGAKTLVSDYLHKDNLVFEQPQSYDDLSSLDVLTAQTTLNYIDTKLGNIETLLSQI